MGSWGTLWDPLTPQISHGFQALIFVFLLQAPPQPFLEMEKLRLVRQLEGLQAKLALSTREDLIPKLSSKDQEEGRGPGGRQVGHGPIQVSQDPLPFDSGVL